VLIDTKELIKNNIIHVYVKQFIDKKKHTNLKANEKKKNLDISFVNFRAEQ
jgi:hypothetical protein